MWLTSIDKLETFFASSPWMPGLCPELVYTCDSCEERQVELMRLRHLHYYN